MVRGVFSIHGTLSFGASASTEEQITQLHLYRRRARFSVTVSATVKLWTFHSRASSPRDLWSAFVWACVLAGFLLGTAFVAAEAIPRFDTVSYAYEEQAPRAGALPLSVESAGKVLHVRFVMNLAQVHPHLFRVIPDDCLQSLTVNDKTVDDPSIGFCDYSAGKHIDLRKWIHPGSNSVEASIGDGGGRGGLSIEASPHDPVVIALFLITLCAVLLCMAMIFRALRVQTLGIVGMAWLLAGGILLRLAYFIVTPFGTRAHDVDGHVEYVRYILTHWWIPPAHEGWQFYQPPLYYITSAVWTWGFSLFGVLRDTDWMQWMAFTSSCVTLGIIALIALELFPRKQEVPDRLRLLFMAVGFPSLVFFAARINNDVLLAPLGLLALLFTLRFIRSARVGEWFLALVCTALGILTKTNVVLILPAVLLSLLLVPHKALRKRSHLMLLGGLLVFLLCGGFFLARMESEGRSRSMIVGNIHSLNSGLLLHNSPSSYFTFNPLAVLRRPFNHAWDDAGRRQYFPEYFFRSAFSGEFDFGRTAQPLAQAVLLTWMFLLPVLALGVYHSFRKHDPVSLVMLATFFGVLGGHIAFRFLFPYSSSQDFRYSILLLIPAFFLLLKGREKIWKGLPRDIVHAVLLAAGVLNILLIGFLLFV